MIGKETLATASDLIRGRLLGNQRAIDEAYTKAEDVLTVSIALKISPNSGPGLKLDAKLSFVAEKITDTASTTVADERQLTFEGTLKYREILSRKFKTDWMPPETNLKKRRPVYYMAPPITTDERVKALLLKKF